MFSVAFQEDKRDKSSAMTLPDRMEPRLISLETPVVALLFLNKML